MRTPLRGSRRRLGRERPVRGTGSWPRMVRSLRATAYERRSSNTIRRSRGRAQSRRLFLEQLENRTLLAAITVTTSVDDVTPNDGSVSLREAIAAVNAGNDLGDPNITAQAPGTFGTNDTINFNIAGQGAQQINLTSALPALTKKVVINGLSQPNAAAGAPLIVLNGAGAGANVDGLTLQ